MKNLPRLECNSHDCDMRRDTNNDFCCLCAIGESLHHRDEMCPKCIRRLRQIVLNENPIKKSNYYSIYSIIKHLEHLSQLGIRKLSKKEVEGLFI